MFSLIERAYGYVNEKSIALTLSVLGIAGVLLGGAEVFAQEGNTVQVTAPNISWGTTAQTLITSFTSVIVVAIGIALSVWALITIVRLFRRSAG